MSFKGFLKDSWEGIVGGLVVLVGVVTLTVILHPILVPPPDITPEENRYGLAEDSGDYTGEAFAAYPEAFAVEGGREDNSGRNVRLWEALLKRNPNWNNVRQPVGDCVAASQCNGLQILGAIKGRDIIPYRPYTYGLARVTIGKNRPGCNSDGAVSSWAIEGFVSKGWLESQETTEPYNAKTARAWGCKGPPANYFEMTKGRTGTAHPVRSIDELIDALANGFPCTIAGMFGTQEETIKKQDGRWVATWNDKWPHQMLFCGYDGSGPTKYFYLLNSWGNDWPQNKPPLQGELPGGVWVTRETVVRMLREGECWALSDIQGFKVDPNEIDWSVFDVTARQPQPKKNGSSHVLSMAL